MGTVLNPTVPSTIHWCDHIAGEFLAPPNDISLWLLSTDRDNFLNPHLWAEIGGQFVYPSNLADHISLASLNLNEVTDQTKSATIVLWIPTARCRPQSNRVTP